MAHGSGAGAIEPTLLWLQARMQALAVSVVANQGQDANVWRPIAAVGFPVEVKRLRLSLERQPRIGAALRGDGVQCFDAQCDWPDPFDDVLIGTNASQFPGHRCLTTRLSVAPNQDVVLTVELPPHGRSLVNLAEQLLDLRPAVLMALRQHFKPQGYSSYPVSGPTGEGALIAQSAAMRQLLGELSLVAGTQLPVLLQGETGVGKEVMAHRIHALSPRAHKGLVQINCAALPETLAESELFGHVKGAFSGAQSDRAGYLQSAHQGSLFLDEVAELSLPLQAKLLRALQNGDIQRVGSDRIQRVDIRVIAASNVDLKEAVVQGRFRADLYHRLAVYPLHVPALRDRQADIGPLTEAILRRLSASMNLIRLDVSAMALATLENYVWPGNVRELEHVLARASLRAASEASHAGVVELQTRHMAELGREHSPALAVTAVKHDDARSALVGECVETGGTLRDIVRLAQGHAIEHALSKHGGRWSLAAESLGLDASNLHKLAKRLGMKGAAGSDALLPASRASLK